MPTPVHPARLKPQTAMATVRFIVASVSYCSPRAAAAAPKRIADKILLKCAHTRVKGPLIGRYGQSITQFGPFQADPIPQGGHRGWKVGEAADNAIRAEPGGRYVSVAKIDGHDRYFGGPRGIDIGG